MRETEIRADDLRSEGRKLYKIDQENILSNKSHFVEVTCPACNKDKKELFYMRDGFTFVRCSLCETVFVSPRPTQEMIFQHYKISLAEKFWNENVYPRSEDARVKYLISPRIKKITELCEKYKIHTESFMDIGAGCGTFCEQVKITGIFKEVVAVEPNPSPAQSCRERGLHVIEDFIENINVKKADVITSIESIEHVFDPKKYVNGIYETLNEGGLLFIATPNIKGFDLLVLKDKSDNTTAPDHLNYFHPKSISLLLERIGFEILEIETPGKLDAELVKNKVTEGAVSLDNQPFLKRILIDEGDVYMDSFQKWLSDNGLSSHMWISARKNGNK
ncbi:MAG TPA: class I SAM-dependent methyltransferase [Candidatus Wunengus sp. YC64]|uniref:class I SAM-dependent methyltransferase n=1 Tax=Candidatus Wunengus sp. YC64 TaxID=3367700 RepID=UPI0040271346